MEAEAVNGSLGLGLGLGLLGTWGRKEWGVTVMDIGFLSGVMKMFRN